MAYADGLRQEVFNPSTAADLIEGNVVKFENNDTTSTDSTTLTTYVALGVSETITVTADEIVEITTGTGSSGTGNTADFKIHRDTTEIGLAARVEFQRSDATGADEFVTLNYVDKPGAGTYTYTLRFKVVGSGTIYARTKFLNTKVSIGET